MITIKYKPSAVFGLGTPSDGLTDDEKSLKSAIVVDSIKTLYGKLPTSRMKLVVAMHFELGYSQEIIAEILSIKQPSLQDEIKHIRRVLSGQPYKPYKKKGAGMVKIEDVMSYLHVLKQQ